MELGVPRRLGIRRLPCSAPSAGWRSGRPRLIVAAWLALGLALTAVAPSWEENSQDDDVSFMPPELPSSRAHALMSEAFPQDVSACRLVLAVERPDADLTPDDLALSDRMAARLRHRPTPAKTSLASRRGTTARSATGSRATTGSAF